VRLPEHCGQRAVMQQLLDRQVSSRRGIMCSHREPAYAGVVATRPLPESEQAQDQCVLLPLYPGMTEDEQNHVAQALRQACSSPQAARVAA